MRWIMLRETEAEFLVTGLWSAQESSWRSNVFDDLKAVRVFSPLFLGFPCNKWGHYCYQIFFCSSWTDYKAVNLLPDYSCHSPVHYLFFWGGAQKAKKWELESKLRAQRLAYCSKYLSTQTCFMFPTSEWLRLSSVCYALILTLVVMESTWIISF